MVGCGGFSRSRVRTNGVKRGRPHYMKVRVMSESRVSVPPMQVALVKTTKKGKKRVPYIKAHLCAECKLHHPMGPNF